MSVEELHSFTPLLNPMVSFTSLTMNSILSFCLLGQETCLLMWGLTSTGLVTVNVFDSSNNVISATASSALQLNTWTHIAQTFSTTSASTANDICRLAFPT